MVLSVPAARGPEGPLPLFLLLLDCVFSADSSIEILATSITVNLFYFSEETNANIIDL